MGYRFWVRSKRDKKKIFTCDLICSQCQGKTKNKTRCEKTTCIGVPYCWMHLRLEKSLSIKKSSVHGLGLFAMKNKLKRSTTKPIFRPGDRIIHYMGEIKRAKQMEKDYPGDTIAPYAIEDEKHKRFVDSDCVRGVGAMANHSKKPNAEVRLGETNQVMTIYAIKKIYHNDEIFIDYGDTYFKNDDSDEHFEFKTVKTNY